MVYSRPDLLVSEKFGNVTAVLLARGVKERAGPVVFRAYTVCIPTIRRLSSISHIDVIMNCASFQLLEEYFLL